MLNTDKRAVLMVACVNWTRACCQSLDLTFGALTPQWREQEQAWHLPLSLPKKKNLWAAAVSSKFKLESRGTWLIVHLHPGWIRRMSEEERTLGRFPEGVTLLPPTQHLSVPEGWVMLWEMASLSQQISLGESKTHLILFLLLRW